MQRRDFLKFLGLGGLSLAAFQQGMWAPEAQAQMAPYGGPILVTFHARGGWDHSFFSDPRENPEINRWASTAPAGIAGNLRYAPVAENQAFFDKYFDRMLVINGIDIQSGSHSSGGRNRTTGRLGDGFPMLNELFAAANGGGMPMAFVNDGGYGDPTVGLAARAGLPSEATLRILASPNSTGSGATTFVRQADYDTVRRYQAERLAAMSARAELLPRWQTQLTALEAARSGVSGLDMLAQSLPAGGIDRNDLTGNRDGLVSSLHLFLVSAAAGLTTTGTFGTGGWDTHDTHDARHATALTRLTRLVDYLWTKAEEVGVADRLVVHITSDVGRTPGYNARNGKDHASVGADIVMKKGAAWGNRIAGASGPGHEKYSIDPVTLAVDNNNGIRLQPRHVQNELRKLLGLDGHPLAQRFPLAAEPVALFDPAVQTGITV